ncbi:hypothetical protein B0H10DRAFT_1772334, partial [Mycena sp. CBHHK59/15]
RLALGRRYDVPGWLVPAYTELCERADPLTLGEAHRLGLDDVVRIGQVRHSIR